MVYCYLRVSTDEQDVNSQRVGIEEFLKSKNMTADSWARDEAVAKRNELTEGTNQ